MVGGGHGEASEEEACGHRAGSAEAALDRALEEQAGQRGRERRLREPGGRAGEAQRGERPGVERDLELLAPLGLDVAQEQTRVGGRRDRQELCRAVQQAERECPAEAPYGASAARARR